MSTGQVVAGLGIAIGHPPFCIDGPTITGPQTTMPDCVPDRSGPPFTNILGVELSDAAVRLEDKGLPARRYLERRQTISVVSAGSLQHADLQMARHNTFVRSDTLQNLSACEARNTSGLKTLMGDANSRLKSGAAVLASDEQASQGKKTKKAPRDAVLLEQAKSRARVEVDIVLESNTCVQGGYLRGQIKVKVRKRSKKEAPVLLAEGKIRVIGFECIPNQDDRHTFFQCTSPLSAATDAFHGLYVSPPDPEGFSQAAEGVHILPFAMHLPLDGPSGVAKGVLNVHSGVAAQYIAMISIRVKDSESGKRSIAHFYRNCEIWPRLDLSTILASAPTPLQASACKGLSMLNKRSKVKLTAFLHRMTWIAGQRCCVRVLVANETKKTVKSLTLTLVRTTTVFRPKPALDTGVSRFVDPDACQTSTLHKAVAETILEMGHRSTKGHASAKGWWTGVGPGQELEFSHYILLPPDALSVTRSRLLEVEHSVRVAVSAGSLTSDIHVTLPIRIVNFLSVDPTPDHSSLASEGFYTRPVQRRRSIDGELGSRITSTNPWSGFPEGGHVKTQVNTSHDHHAASHVSSSLHHRLPSEHTSHSAHSSRTSGLRVTNPDRYHHPFRSALQSSDEDDSSVYSTDASKSQPNNSYPSANELSGSALGNLDLDDPDSDEEVGFVVGAARVDGGNSNTQPGIAPGPGTARQGSRVGGPRPLGSKRESRAGKSKRDARAAGGTSFAQRVQEKLASTARNERRRDVHVSVDGDATPRLGHVSALYSGRHPVASQSETVSAIRMSRQLPALPPSTSEAEASTSYAVPRSRRPMDSDSRNNARYHAVSSSPLLPATSRPVLSSHSSASVYSSQSAASDRPIAGMRYTGVSASAVKGRIAELEQRVMNAQAAGTAYL
ncbi:hypothetical protein AcW2_000631 [Taiwanofungus camphoratus]|nr:hypothetical protein AcW2_000631 [Antrodia cinnamomea]